MQTNSPSPIKTDQIAQNKQFIAVGLSILLTILWGTTFIFTKLITQEMPIFFLTGMRHLLALVGFLPWIKYFAKINRRILKMALITGCANFLMLTFQTYGMQMNNSAGKTGFLTALYIIISPFLNWMLFRKPVSKRVWVAAGVCLLGMMIIFDPFQWFGLAEGQEPFGLGDFLVIVCAFFAASQIVFTGRFFDTESSEKSPSESQKVDVIAFTLCQLLIITIGGFTFSLFFDPPYAITTLPTNLWIMLLFLGIAATTIPFLLQNVIQRMVDASKVAIYFSLEPVFATIFGVLIGNESITWMFIVGAAVVLGSLILAIKS